VARIINKALLQSYHSKKCIICNTQAEPHHIKSVGSGGHDLDDNLLSICRLHHHQAHAMGLRRFTDKFPQVESELITKGWELDEYTNKWVNYNLLEVDDE